MELNNLILNLQKSIKKSENSEISFLPSEDFSLFNNSENLHFVGFGSAGSNIVEYLQSKEIKAKFTCISNPLRPNISNKIQFLKYIYPLEKDVDFEIEIPLSILKIFESDEKFILLSGLGGNTGTFLTVAISELLNKKNIPFLAISSLPLKIESEQRHKLANLALNKLEKVSSFKYYTFTEIKLLFNINMNFKEVFEKVNELIFRIYEANK